MSGTRLRKFHHCREDYWDTWNYSLFASSLQSNISCISVQFARWQHECGRSLLSAIALLYLFSMMMMMMCIYADVSHTHLHTYSMSTVFCEQKLCCGFRSWRKTFNLHWPLVLKRLVFLSAFPACLGGSFVSHCCLRCYEWNSGQFEAVKAW